MTALYRMSNCVFFSLNIWKYIVYIYGGSFPLSRVTVFMKLLFSRGKKQKEFFYIKFTICIYAYNMSNIIYFSDGYIYRFEWHFNILFNFDLNFMFVQNLCRLQVFELYGIYRTENNCIYKLWLKYTYINLVQAFYLIWIYMPVKFVRRRNYFFFCE